ncbi:GNAT family N-acetyltransferase [Phenylobacterium sp. 20VBR1]|uniref:GNAT family N-acetyltransferase n=1 Tax=Phenylobacterium glaciei TaxID=2803784 RepID=A0A941CXC6_9CAUL|nr:GNAT family N-acetyltransferase [Phenylobacterium glaciei]MBR7618350.1 GNAT family N-acetyltransferase [Phenylobacterium glaciei]
MEIRVLKAGDEALLMAAVDHLAEEGPLTQQAATRHLADTDLVSVVALEDQVPVGFVYGHVLRRFEKTSFFIYAVDVDEAFQRRGIAKAMLGALSDLGRKGRWDEMFVFTNASNTPAMALYASAGGVRPNPDDVMFDFEG